MVRYIKFIRGLLIVLCMGVLPSCSPAQDAALSELDQITMKAGRAQGVYWKDMQSQTDGMTDEQRMEWGSVGFGKWYEKNVDRSSLSFFGEFYEYGQKNLGSPSGFDALLMALEVSSGSGIDYKKIQNIHNLMYENYLDHDDYALVLQRINANVDVGHKPPVGEGPEVWTNNRPQRYERVIMLLERVVDTAKNPRVKNQAMLSLGDYIGRSLNYMDKNDADGIREKRVHSENLLNQVVANDKENPITLLLSKDVKILELYNKSLQQETASPDDAKRPPRPKMEIPTLGSVATRLLYDFKNLSIGKSLPDTIGVDLDGNPQDINQYKGTVLLVDFWATWCGPCIAKMPHMRDLKEKYAERPFEILGISADSELADVTGFLEDTDLPWDLWFSGKDKGVVKAWNITAFPTVFLVDHKGVVVSKNPSDEQLEAMLVGLVYSAEQAAGKK